MPSTPEKSGGSDNLNCPEGQIRISQLKNKERGFQAEGLSCLKAKK